MECLGTLSTKIITEQPIIKIEKSLRWAKLRASLETCFPDDSEKLLQRSRVFSTVLHLIRTNYIKQVRLTFLQGLKKKKKNRPPCTQRVSTYDFATWEGSLTIEGGPALASQEGRQLLYFLTRIFFTSGWCALLFLIFKTDGQCVFDRPQIGYFS